MKKDELIQSLWREAPITKRLLGREGFEKAFAAAVETAPIYQICYGAGAVANQQLRNYTQERWRARVAEHPNCQFGPLTWIVVGSIINFLIWKLLEWATQTRANAVILAGWSAESSWRTSQ